MPSSFAAAVTLARVRRSASTAASDFVCCQVAGLSAVEGRAEGCDGASVPSEKSSALALDDGALLDDELERFSCAGSYDCVTQPRRSSRKAAQTGGPVERLQLLERHGAPAALHVAAQSAAPASHCSTRPQWLASPFPQITAVLDA